MSIKIHTVKLEEKPQRFSLEEILKIPGVYYTHPSDDFRIVITEGKNFYISFVVQGMCYLNTDLWQDNTFIKVNEKVIVEFQ